MHLILVHTLIRFYSIFLPTKTMRHSQQILYMILHTRLGTNCVYDELYVCMYVCMYVCRGYVCRGVLCMFVHRHYKIIIHFV